jgi:hypothetical protein
MVVDTGETDNEWAFHECNNAHQRFRTDLSRPWRDEGRAFDSERQCFITESRRMVCLLYQLVTLNFI